MQPAETPSDTAVIILTCSLSAPRRLASALARAEALFEPERIQVAHGFVGADPEIDRLFDRAAAWWRCKRMPTRNEIAAYATHRLGWQMLLDGPWRHALVLEDDFDVRDPALVRDAVERAAALLGDGRHIVKLFDFPRDRSRNIGIATVVAGIRLMKWQRTRAGMVGYLISRRGAEIMLSRRRVYRVVDEDIKYFWELGLDVWSAPGNPIAESAPQLGGSVLEKERREARKLNLLRSLKGLLITAHRDWQTRRHYERYARRFLRDHAPAQDTATVPAGHPPPVA